MFTGKHRGVYEWKVERPISHSFRNWALLLELSFNFKAFINPKNAAGEAIMISEIIRKLLFTLLCPFYVVGWGSKLPIWYYIGWLGLCPHLVWSAYRSLADVQGATFSSLKPQFRRCCPTDPRSNRDTAKTRW